MADVLGTWPVNPQADVRLIFNSSNQIVGIAVPRASGGLGQLRVDAPSNTNVTTNSGYYFLEASNDTLTAFAGGGQASALQLVGQMNRVTTVATAGDSVKLPASVAGLEVTVINHGANAMQVYGLGTDTINDVAAATGVSQMPGSTVLYFCTTAGNWYTEGLAAGFSGNFASASFAGGLTAHAGGGQGSATPITTMVSRFTTVASANDSAVLPATVANISIGPLTVTNAHATNSMNLFPASGDAINAGAANAAYAIAAGKTATLYSAGAGQWHAVLSA
jgi:hypothetical protein